MTAEATNSARSGYDLECYPNTAIEKQLSIFCVPLCHGLTGVHLGKTTWWDERANRFDRAGWRLHSYCVQGDRFQPEEIFMKDALKIHFGDNAVSPGSTQITGDYLRTKLDPWYGQGNTNSTEGLVESLFFTLEPCQFGGTWTISELGTENIFTIRWVDLLLFNDGLGILAINVTLTPDSDIDLSQLNRLHRMLRCLPVVPGADGIAYRLNTGADGEFITWQGSDFWTEVVHATWLVNGSLLAPITDPCNMPPQKPYALSFLPNQRYAKILVQVQNSITEKNRRFWARPLIPPSELFGEQERANITEGIWPSHSLPLMQSRIAGAPTIRDAYVFELATLSDQYAAVSWQGLGRSWQYSFDYLHNIIKNNCVKVWEYWTCVALRDTCVFVAFDNSMPITHQTESRYYPLYLAVYHLRLRLEQIGSDIIEYDMADVWHGREIKDQMIRFRNHYRFKEMTKDFVGVEVFNKMKQGMSVDELYEQLNSDVKDVSDHLQQKWDRGNRVLLALLVIFLKPIEKGWDQLLNSRVYKNAWACISNWLLTPSYHMLVIPFLFALSCYFLWRWYPTLICCYRFIFKRFRRLVVRSDRHRGLR